MGNDPIRVMIEAGRKKQNVAVAVALDWPGWARSGTSEDDSVAVLGRYRRRYATVAAEAGLTDEFEAAGDFAVADRIVGIGMTDFYRMSAAWAASEEAQLSPAELERRLALLEASWATLDAVAARVSPELRKGPRGGGRERDQIVNHANGAEIFEYAPKVGVKVPLDTRLDPAALHEYRRAFIDGIGEFAARGSTAGNWPIAFLIRRCAWHMLDHAWEMEDRDLSNAA